MEETDDYLFLKFILNILSPLMQMCLFVLIDFDISFANEIYPYVP